uniref:Uncharacterized protein n=1 Tax=Panagrellus redivivus TaxID=6233 RepID=A0A7E4V445_PANRE
MRRFLTYESDQIPWAQLPYGFKRRVTALAPVDDLNNIRQTCFEYNDFCNPRPEVRDQLYITDDETIHEWAVGKVFVFSIFRFIYWLWRWIFDGFSFRPTWHSVLYVDNIVKKGRPIFVTDTLVLHCRSVASFERLIPYICGPYTRLMIHGGSISLDQLRRLMKGTLRKVEITAEIELEFDEYDDAVQLIIQHVRGFRYNFNLDSTPHLIVQVEAALENIHYVAIKTFYNSFRCNVIHWKMALLGSCAFGIHGGWTFSTLLEPIIKVLVVEKEAPPANTEDTWPLIDDAIECLMWFLYAIEDYVFFAMIFMFISVLALSHTLKSKPDP